MKYNVGLLESKRAWSKTTYSEVIQGNWRQAMDDFQMVRHKRAQNSIDKLACLTL